jgi:hypothetical protein
MIDDSVKEVTFIPNTKYEVLTPTGFKHFDGLAVGQSDNVVTYNDMKMTEGHLIKEDNEFREAKTLGTPVSGNFTVFDLVDVEGHEYLSKGMTHHNCQTGDQLIKIYDKKHDCEREVTFTDLQNAIALENVGIDYFSVNVIKV